MPAAKFDFTTYRREYFEAVVTLTDAAGDAIDLGGTTAIAEVRKPEDPGDSGDPLLDLSATIIGDGSTGQVSLEADVGELATKIYSWDLFIIYPGPKPKKLLFGEFSVKASTSRPA